MAECLCAAAASETASARGDAPSASVQASAATTAAPGESHRVSCAMWRALKTFLHEFLLYTCKLQVCFPGL